MKALAVFLFLFSLFSCFGARADVPAEAPDSAYFVTSCNQIVFVLIRVNGKDLTYDRYSQESADDVKAFASRSKEPARVYEVGCFEIGDRSAT